MLESVIENKALVKFFYGLILSIVCFAIVKRSHKMFNISLHQGIRYFRNAFLFFAIAFIIRYLVAGVSEYLSIGTLFSFLYAPIFEYFMVMGGFFLLYSLIWRKIENQKESPWTSILNSRILIFHIMAIIIAIGDLLWTTYLLMFISQIIIFTIASGISFLNYRKSKSNKGFSKFYFIAMFLILLAWILNALAGFYFDWNQMFIIIIYLLNIFVFLLFLWGVYWVTKR